MPEGRRLCDWDPALWRARPLLAICHPAVSPRPRGQDWLALREEQHVTPLWGLEGKRVL